MGIDLDDDGKDKGQRSFFSDGTDELINQFKQKKNEYQNEPDRDKKKGLKKEVDNLIIMMFETRLKMQKADYFSQLQAIEKKYSVLPSENERNEIIAKEKETLYKKTGFNLEAIEKQLREFTEGLKVKPFFAWKLYFAEVFHEKGGYDIVVGNPPYGFRDVLSPEEKKFFRKDMKIEFPSGDMAELFIIISLNKCVTDGGTLTFIIPKKSLYGESWSNLRKIWINNDLQFLMDASKAFENVLLEQVAFGVQKRSKTTNRNILIGALDFTNSTVNVFGGFKITEIFTKNLQNAQIYRGLYPQEMIKKIADQSVTDTSSLLKAEIGISNITSHLTFELENNYPCVKGIDIVCYGLKNNVRYLKGKIAKKFVEQFKNEKLIAQEIIAHIQNPIPHIQIAILYDNNGRMFNDTCVEIKLLNSKITKKVSFGILTIGILQLVFLQFYLQQGNSYDAFY